MQNKIKIKKKQKTTNKQNTLCTEAMQQKNIALAPLLQGTF